MMSRLGDGRRRHRKRFRGNVVGRCQAKTDSASQGRPRERTFAASALLAHSRDWSQVRRLVLPTADGRVALVVGNSAYCGDRRASRIRGTTPSDVGSGAWAGWDSR